MSSSIELTITSLKGQTLGGLELEATSTVRDLKYAISSRMFRQQVATMNLVYRAKYLSNEDQRLRDAGMCPGKKHQVHLVAKFDGGGRTPVQEIAYQLKFVKQGKLHALLDVEPEDEFTWNLMLRGPVNSPYKDALFSITFKFPSNYPYSAPAIKFNTPIFHPNVFSNGNVCWHEDDSTGSKYFADVLIGAVNVLLERPNPDSPANQEAAQLYVNNRAEFNRRAKAIAAQFPYIA